MATGYDAIEGALQTILQALTGTFANSGQVTRGDWRVMDHGFECWAVLYPGEYEETSADEPVRNGSIEIKYTTKLLLGVRYLNDGTTRQTLVQKRDAVMRQLRAYPYFNRLASDTAYMGLIRSDGEPEAVFPTNEKGGPYFLVQQFTIPSSETSTVTVSG